MAGAQARQTVKCPIFGAAALSLSSTCIIKEVTQARLYEPGGAMKQVFLVGVLVVALGFAVSAQTGNTTLGTVTLSKAVMADGQKLAAGTYQVRLTNDQPKPGAGQSPDAERYVEFVRGGKVVGREVATVVADADVKTIIKSSKKPAAGGAQVELLKGNDYLRVWLNSKGNNYLIHMPPA
jgi:hypothetical protein